MTPLRMSSVSSSGLASSLERLTCYERALPKGLAYMKEKLSKLPIMTLTMGKLANN